MKWTRYFRKKSIIKKKILMKSKFVRYNYEVELKLKANSNIIMGNLYNFFL